MIFYLFCKKYFKVFIVLFSVSTLHFRYIMKHPQNPQWNTIFIVQIWVEWPIHINNEVKEQWIKKGSSTCQHKDLSVEESAAPRTDRKSGFRTFSKGLFTRSHVYGSVVERNQSYMFHCHNNSIRKFLQRLTKKCRIDTKSFEIFESESNYMKNVLHKIVNVVKFLATCGLAFRGSEEKIGSQTNENFLGIIELISQYDPLLTGHLVKYANLGSGKTSSTAQKMKFSIRNFFSKCDQIRRKLQISSHLLKKKFLMENFFFCTATYLKSFTENLYIWWENRFLVL